MLKKYDYEKMPIVEVVNDILVDASKRGASDIHFDPHEDFMKIRIRIDGALIDYSEVPNSVKKNLITRIKIISGMNITESRLPQDGAIKTSLQGINLDLRTSCLPTLNGEKIVVRILDYTMSSSGLENLGFSQSNYEKVVKMINIPNGIVLVTGATGSGKSTTVYAILQKLNREETNIITVEDPIEMNIEGINQVQTNSEIGLTFATALRSILRQDPNVIMIGEIRDTETARIAVRASITGHIVLSTIHTNSSLNTIERLLDMDVERYLLASALTGIISQKLARRLCPHCKTARKTNDYERNLFKRVLHRDVDEIYTTEGCDECRNGYKGRIAIHEVLLVNQEIKDAISSNMPKSKLRELVYSADVTTLLQDGLEKVAEGLTTFEEVLKLIELDNDDRKGGKYDLKDALDYTHISHINNSSSNDNSQNKNSDNSNIEINDHNYMSNNSKEMDHDNSYSEKAANDNNSVVFDDPFEDEKQENIKPEPTVDNLDEINNYLEKETEKLQETIKNTQEENPYSSYEELARELKEKKTSIDEDVLPSEDNANSIPLDDDEDNEDEEDLMNMEF